MLEPITNLCSALQAEGYSFRVACQSGLFDAVPRARAFFDMASRCGTNVSLRIVTGSCYSKSGNGYKPTLETSFSETNEAFFQIVNLSVREQNSETTKSAVGTGDLERILYAAEKELEIQFLKGEEDTPAYRTGQQLMDDGANMAMYTTFGALSDSGVQGYLKRRA